MMTDRLSNTEFTHALIVSRRALACVTGDHTRDGRWSYFLSRPVGFVVNKGDGRIRCFSQFRNELLRIREGRAELGC